MIGDASKWELKKSALKTTPTKTTVFFLSG
jgi:hypothetical protein